MNRYIQSLRLKAEHDTLEDYLYELPVYQYLSEHPVLPFDRPVTFFVGENGTGKSTLLETIAIAMGFNAEGGTRNFSFHTADTHSSLANAITIARTVYPKDGFFLRAESFYNAASYLAEVYKDEYQAGVDTVYGKKSLHEQSHGESFLALIQNRFNGHGIYLLDEPEAALSPSRQLTLLSEINLLVKADSQFIIATHSPILLAYPNATIYQFSEEGIKEVRYEETEHYQLTKQFLNDPARYLRYLFADDTE